VETAEVSKEEEKSVSNGDKESKMETEEKVITLT